jgi:hypothetical protein
MAYIGCILFGLMFMVMTAQSTGSLQARVEHTLTWLHAWAPFSYLIILLVIAAPFVSVKIMNSWPKQVEPESPMAKYRREAGDGTVED